MTAVAERTTPAVAERIDPRRQGATRHRREKPRHRHRKPSSTRPILPILWVVLSAVLAAFVVSVCVFQVTSGTLTGLLLVLVVLGINTVFWSTVGIGRYLAEHLPSSKRRHHPGTDVRHRFRPQDVAVLIPAHNEAAVLANSLRAASALLPVSNIHVVSDGSTDRTADVGREFGVHVLELSPNRGKAGALLEGIRHFELASDYAVVLFLDADTRPALDYLETGLPEFDDADVVAVAGRVKCLLDPPPRTRTGRFLVAYRARLYAVVQLLVKYGQAAQWANVVSIVPGFASMYRTDVLARIDIAAPGLVIEDFNMTFEVHAKSLGRIAFRPDAAVAYTQDPDTLHDYVHQIGRWSLGFWQTVRLHGLHAGRFWLVLAVQIAETLSSSVILLFMLPLMLFAVYSNTLADTYGHPHVMGRELVGTLGPQYVLIGFLVPDLLLTVFAAIALRRGSLLLLAPLFPAMRIVDAYVCLRSIATAWRTHSSGVWISPARREGPSPAPLPSSYRNLGVLTCEP
jgi:biofilm PGA synthesis N-glycosyltransferase PgaC